MIDNNKEVEIVPCLKKCLCSDGYVGLIGSVRHIQRGYDTGYLYNVLLLDGRDVWVHKSALTKLGDFEYGLWIE